MEILQDLEKAINGDKKAFNNIIGQVERKLYIIAKSRVSNEEDIKDIIQDTVLYAYINIKELRQKEKFIPWITTILINNCNKLYIKNKIKLLSYEDIEADKIKIKEDIEIDKLENELNFFNIINFLDIEDKTIITMYYLEDYTTKEISDILKINESTLRSRISSIRNKIKDRYRKEIK